jgi:hypothetical protein
MHVAKDGITRVRALEARARPTLVCGLVSIAHTRARVRAYTRDREDCKLGRLFARAVRERTREGREVGWVLKRITATYS